MIITQFIYGICLGGFGGPMQIFMVDSVSDVGIRYSVMGVAYNLCQATYGGTAPMIGTALSLASILWVAVYVLTVAIVSGLLLHFRDKNNKKLGYLFVD